MPRNGFSWNAELLCGRSQYQRGAVQLVLRHLFLVEVALADDKEVTGRVVGRRGVAHEVGTSQLVDVPVAIDAEVIGNVDPPLRVLVVALVLAQPAENTPYGRIALLNDPEGVQFAVMSNPAS